MIIMGKIHDKTPWLPRYYGSARCLCLGIIFHSLLWFISTIFSSTSHRHRNNITSLSPSVLTDDYNGWVRVSEYLFYGENMIHYTCSAGWRFNRAFGSAMQYDCTTFLFYNHWLSYIHSGLTFPLTYLHLFWIGFILINHLYAKHNSF